MDRDLILYLNAIGISYKYYEYLLEIFQDLDKLLERKGRFDDLNLTSRMKSKLEKAYFDFNLDDYKESLWKVGAKFMTQADDCFPEHLRHIPDPPYLLYYKGQWKNIFNYSIGVVGARKCTNYGVWAVQEIAGGLSQMGIPIASGLALGIDKIAHQWALSHNNYTVAVLGTGIDKEYPASNRNVYRQMNNHEKAVILSEYPLGTSAARHTFPWRNRIISGIGLGLVIVEAKKHSGTLITAKYAAEQGKEVFAVPGNINSIYSKGTNELIKDGAKIVTGIEDILVELPQLRELTEEKKISIDFDGFSQGERRVYQALEEFPKHPDELCFQLDMGVQEVMLNLTKLEMKGYINQIGDKFTISFSK
ncbi:MAG: DNA-processing protein DprA [Tissierellia bacterium]|nr:DNA-processing protein DprA [Tissierellia bacterium]